MAATAVVEVDDTITPGPSGSYSDEALWNYCIAFVIKSGNTQQAFDDSVATYYFIWCGFDKFPLCLPYIFSGCSKTQNICIFICFLAICVLSLGS